MPVFNLVFIPFIYLFYPETRNLTLEQIDRLFTGEKVLLHWHPSMGVGGDPDTRVANTKNLEEDTKINHVENP